MVEKEITETVEVTDVEEVTETVVFCEGCGMETEEYRTFTDVIEQIEEADIDEDDLGPGFAERFIARADTLQFCPGCLHGMEENQSIPAGLYSEGDDSDTDHPEPSGDPFVEMMADLVDEFAELLEYLVPTRPASLITALLWGVALGFLYLGVVGGGSAFIGGLTMATMLWMLSVVARIVLD